MNCECKFSNVNNNNNTAVHLFFGDGYSLKKIFVIANDLGPILSLIWLKIILPMPGPKNGLPKVYNVPDDLLTYTYKTIKCHIWPTE